MKLGLLASVWGSVLSLGHIGHWLSGRVASSFLTLEGAQLVSNLVGIPLESATSWADNVKKRPAYRWSSQLHYVNPPNDDPPSTCSLDKLSCPSGACITTAITNYTARMCSGSDPIESFRFLIHFVGDIHDPLHTTGKQRGGNSAQARFNGRLTSLHNIWDTMMFEKRIKDFASKEDYANHLIESIHSTWKTEVQHWNACKDDIMIHEIPSCPLSWATHSNLVNCDTVWPGYKRKYELSGSYYNSSIPVAEKLLAQAGFRMATVINALAIQCPALKTHLVDQSGH